MNVGAVAPAGETTLRVIRPGAGIGPARPVTVAEIVQYGTPQKGLPEEVNDWRSDNTPAIRRALRQHRAHRKANRAGLPHFWSQLFLTKIDGEGRRLELGLAGCRVVTTAGVNFIVDAFQATATINNMRYHGIGTDNTAEAVGDTALGAESTTALNPDSTRATGTQTEGAGANVYRTVGTLTADAAIAAVEHGIFDQAATGGGTLLDRTVFAVVNLANGDSLESTYDLTLTAGS